MKQKRILRIAMMLVLAWPLTGFAQVNPAAEPAYKVRIVYLIPSNRQVQPEAEKVLQLYALSVQGFYRESMARLGYGGKTFQFETEQGSSVPKVHLAHVSQPDTAFHDFDFGARFTKILNGVASAGFAIFAPGEVLLVIAETHRQLADGSFLQSSVFFGGAGAALAGVGVVTGETLARMPSSFLTDDRPYDGSIVPTMGPFPLVANLSFPAFEGVTFSSTSSSAQGGAAHEIGHGFALPHDFRNDENFHGNLMGNGFRGFRGFFYPERYPNEAVGLSSASALHLNYSRFFNAENSFTDNNGPIVNVLDAGTVAPSRGLFNIRFRTFDSNSQLAGAVLLRNGNAVADMPLAENDVTTSISTYDYQPGVRDAWEIIVFDTEGNRTSSGSFGLTPAPGFNRAPIPFVRLSKTNVLVGEAVRLDASRSFDPDGSSSQLNVEWDLNGDNVFDTLPSTVKTLEVSYSIPGVYQVVARLTDPEGASLSMPMGLRVEPPIVNSLVTLDPLTSAFTPDARGCPSGYAGKFSLGALLTNRGLNGLSRLRIEIAKLTTGNLLLAGKELLSERQLFDVPGTDAGAAPVESLATGESANVPFTICLEKKQGFEFFVNVHGMVD